MCFDFFFADTGFIRCVLELLLRCAVQHTGHSLCIARRHDNFYISDCEPIAK